MCCWSICTACFTWVLRRHLVRRGRCEAAWGCCWVSALYSYSQRHLPSAHAIWWQCPELAACGRPLPCHHHDSCRKCAGTILNQSMHSAKALVQTSTSSCGALNLSACFCGGGTWLPRVLAWSRFSTHTNCSFCNNLGNSNTLQIICLLHMILFLAMIQKMNRRNSPNEPTAQEDGDAQDASAMWSIAYDMRMPVLASFCYWNTLLMQCFSHFLSDLGFWIYAHFLSYAQIVKCSSAFSNIYCQITIYEGVTGELINL